MLKVWILNKLDSQGGSRLYMVQKKLHVVFVAVKI